MKQKKPNKETKPDWKTYEILIHKIYKELAPLANVTLDDHIVGILSSTERQIDVSIRTKVAGHEILIIVQGKNLKKRADLKVVGEFDSVIKDVNASKGILICNAGFTKNAKEYASKLKIDLCTVHDANIKNWATEIQIPVIKKTIKVFLNIKHHYAPKRTIDLNGITFPFPELAVNEFLEKWERNELNKEPGEHYLDLSKDSVLLHDDFFPIKSGIEYKVIHRHHFKHFIPTDYRGIKDYLTERFTPSFMAFNEKIPILNDGSWKFIENPNDISIKSLHLNIEIIDIDMLKKTMIRTNWEDSD